MIGYEHNCWHYHIGTYYGYITQKFPPEDFIMESMPEITIYRQKNGEITYLPGKYYDDLDDFNVYKDVFFDTHVRASLLCSSKSKRFYSNPAIFKFNDVA